MKATSYVTALALAGLLLLAIAGGVLVFGESLAEAPLVAQTANETISVQQGAWHYLDASNLPRAAATGNATITDAQGTQLTAPEDYEYDQDRLRVMFETCGDQGANTTDGCAEHGENVTVGYPYEAPPESQTAMHQLMVQLMAVLPWLALVFAPLGLLALFGALYGLMSRSTSGVGGR